MATKAIVLLPRDLKKGMKGTDVQMMKRALSMAGFGKWKPFTKLFGPAYIILLMQFQKKHGLKQDAVYGAATHRKLAPFYDAWGMKNMNELANKRDIQNEPAARMVTAAMHVFNFCRLTGRGRYTQAWSRMSIVRNRLKIPFSSKEFLTEDCSSSCKGIGWLAKVPDINNTRYDLVGYTGSISVHGFRINIPTIAAFGFYGWGWPYKHMTMCVAISDGVAYVFSWGSGLPRILRHNYRSDFNHWRSGFARNQ